MPREAPESPTALVLCLAVVLSAALLIGVTWQAEIIRQQKVLVRQLSMDLGLLPRD